MPIQLRRVVVSRSDLHQPPGAARVQRQRRRGAIVPVVAVQTLLMAVGVVALVIAPLVPWGYAATARIVAPAALAAALVLGVATWLFKRTGRRRSRTKETLAWIEGLHVCAGRFETRARPASRPTTAHEEESGGAPSVTRRVLELQIRSLEAALEEQQHRADQLRLAAESQPVVTGLRHQERAILVVQALRSVVSAHPGLSAANRVEAALSRLGSSSAFVRPMLAASPSGSTAVALCSPQMVPPFPDAAEVPTQLTQTPAPQADFAAPDQPVHDGVEAVAAEDRETPHEPQVAPVASRPVLPMPAPRPTTPPTRRGRRLRRTAVA